MFKQSVYGKSVNITDFVNNLEDYFRYMVENFRVK